ncbi:hypothetical protein FRB99_008085 [Tulasnella sp. 403]|nr:hypothetical protein FRB99_008085 [Tulasnella sp. 403]
MKQTTVFSVLWAVGLAVASSVKLFTLDLTVGSIAPDGTKRQAYLINGQTPGPNLIIDQGDEVSVTINNRLNVPSTIHFHGIEQSGTLWSDGVPGVTQHPIQPGSTFVANWTATQHGMYWYHSHSRAIYGDGVRGGLFIRPNSKNLNNSPLSQISNDPDELAALKKAHSNPKIISLVDWTHWTSEEGLTLWNKSRIDITCIDSVLINGKGRQICPDPSVFLPYTTGNPVVPNATAKGCPYPNNTVTQPFPDIRPDLLDPSIYFECTNTTTPLEVIEVDPKETWVSIAFVNMAAIWDFIVSIDDHPLWVYAADGQYHDVQKVDTIGVSTGDRYQVMIKLDKPWNDYAIRVAISGSQLMSGYATLSYTQSKGSGTYIPDPVNPAQGYGGDTLPGFTALNITTLQAFPPSLHPPQKANVTLAMDLIRLDALTWVLNSDPFAAFLELEEPLLFDPHSPASLNPKLALEYPVGSVVDVVFIAHPGNPSHVIHKHGTKAWVIGQSSGTNWTWSNVAEAQKDVPYAFNLDRPSLRDGFTVPAAITTPSWLVIRYEVLEPGVIFMHCHVNTHAVSGMDVTLIEGDPTTIDIPQYYRDFDQQAGQARSQTKIRKARALTRGVDSGSLLPRIVRPS